MNYPHQEQKKSTSKLLRMHSSWRTINATMIACVLILASLYTIFAVGSSIDCRQNVSAQSGETVANLWGDMLVEDAENQRKAAEIERYQAEQQEMQDRSNGAFCFKQDIYFVFIFALCSLFLIATYLTIRHSMKRLLVDKIEIQYFLLSPLLVGAVIFLLIATGSQESSYYQFLRIAVTSISIYFAYIAHKLRAEDPLVWIFAGVAILFNPLVPVYLNHELWSVIDIVTAILLTAGVIVIKKKIRIKNH